MLDCFDVRHPAKFERVSAALNRNMLVGLVLQSFIESEYLFNPHWFERSMTG